MNYHIFIGYKLVGGARYLSEAIELAKSYGSGTTVVDTLDGRTVFEVK